MKVTVDKHGRVLIPKPIRDRLGLEAGTELELSVQPDENGEALMLRPAARPTLIWRDGVLVHTGTIDEPLNPGEYVHKVRDARVRQLLDPSA